MCYTIHKGAGGLECRPALFAYWLMYSMAACQLSNFISLVPYLTYQYSPIGKGNHCAPFRLCGCTGFFVATLHFSCGLVTAIGCISLGGFRRPKFVLALFLYTMANRFRGHLILAALFACFDCCKNRIHQAFFVKNLDCVILCI